MANNCAYDVMAVGKTKESVERVFKILVRDDDEFFLNRVFSAGEVDPPKIEDGLWVYMIGGDTAWSTEPWVRDGVDKTIVGPTGAHLSNLQEICKSLGVGVEVFGEEIAMGVQEHFLVNHIGDVVAYEAHSDLKVSECGEFRELVGGVEDFMVFEDPKKIYGG